MSVQTIKHLSDIEVFFFFEEDIEAFLKLLLCDNNLQKDFYITCWEEYLLIFFIVSFMLFHSHVCFGLKYCEHFDGDIALKPITLEGHCYHINLGFPPYPFPILFRNFLQS